MNAESSDRKLKSRCFMRRFVSTCTAPCRLHGAALRWSGLLGWSRRPVFAFFARDSAHVLSVGANKCSSLAQRCHVLGVGADGLAAVAAERRRVLVVFACCQATCGRAR